MSTPAPIPFSIAPSCSRRVRVGWIRAEPVRVGPADVELREEMARTAEALQDEHGGQLPSAIPGLDAARRLYRAFGIDPTRTRPSSEALLRRAMRGKPLPEISNAVDVANLCAVRFLLPLGLYDTDRLRGSITLREGLPGESFPGIRKDDVHLEGRPALVDELGPFGNPTSDSLRTSVTVEATSLWMVIFAPAGYPIVELAAHVRTAADLMERHLGAAGTPVDTQAALLP